MATYTVAGPDRFTQHLAGVNLIGQDLTATNYVGADLRGAKLDFCILTGADFTNADLTNASLRYATLANCTFTGADLTGVDLTGANLYGTSILSDHYTGAVPQYYFHQSLLDTVPVNVEPFPTAPVDGYLVWFDADTLGLTNTAGVPTLTDSSTNGNDALQATEAKQGTFATNAQNGHSAVTFDGANTWYQTSGTMTAATVFVVVNHTDTGNTAFSAYHRILDGADQAGWSLMSDDTASTTYNVIERNIDTTQESTAPGMWINGAATNSALAPDLATYRIISANITIPGAQKLSVGTYGNSGSQLLKGNIAEYIIYGPTALSDADRKKVESYLSHKYNIAVTA